MKKILLIIAFLVSFLVADSYEDTYKEFAKISKINYIYTSMLDKDVIIEMLNSQLYMYGIETDKELRDGVTNIVINVLNDAKSDIEKEIFALYKKYYTQDDLEKLIEFFKSDIGQKVADASTVIGKEEMLVGNKVMARYFPKMKDEIEKLLSNHQK